MSPYTIGEPALMKLSSCAPVVRHTEAIHFPAEPREECVVWKWEKLTFCTRCARSLSEGSQRSTEAREAAVSRAGRGVVSFVLTNER